MSKLSDVHFQDCLLLKGSSVALNRSTRIGLARKIPAARAKEILEVDDATLLQPHDLRWIAACCPENRLIQKTSPDTMTWHVTTPLLKPTAGKWVKSTFRRI